MISFIFSIAILTMLGCVVAFIWSIFKKKENKAKIGKIFAGAFLATGLTSSPANEMATIKNENAELKQELKLRESEEVKRKEESEERERQESEERVRKESEEKERKESEERVRKESEEKERKESEEKERKESEERVRKESEEKERIVKEQEAQKRREAQLKSEREEQVKREQENSYQQAPQGIMSNPEPNSTNGNTGGGITGYCKDGTTATGNPSARGRANSCYGHGGWVR